jgi:two-component system sensor histidine kinase UhpB
LDDLQPREQLTRDGADMWWRLTVSPYRRSDDSADGVVIALVDVDALKRAESDLLEGRTLAQWIVETVHQPLLAIDAELAIVSANRAYCQSLATTESSLRGQRLRDVDPQWDEPHLRTWLQAVMHGTDDAAEREITTDGPASRQLTLRAHKIVPTRGGAQLLIAIEDITARRRQERGEADLLARVLSAQAEEREHLARELHDETGQALSALLMGLQTAFEQIEDPVAAASVATLREQARTLLDAVGRLARGLHPPSLAELGLGGAIRELVDGFALTHPVAVKLRLEGERHFAGLAAATQLALYRVVQEGLTNIGRHADATSVSVGLDHGGEQVTLRIADDGHGFEPTASARGGLGLQLMRRRIASLHGNLTLRTVPHDGTVLDIVVPAGAASE